MKLSLCESTHQPPPAYRESLGSMQPGNDVPCFIEWVANWVRNLQNAVPFGHFLGFILPFLCSKTSSFCALKKVKSFMFNR
jgi:hypothetical protein